MGVVVGPRTFELALPDNEEYAGVKVLTRGLSVGEALDFLPYVDGVFIAPVMAAEDIEARNERYTLFASRIVEWNLEASPGVPLPATLEGMCALDWRWARDFIRAWVRQVTEVGDPLPKPSRDGMQSLVASIPMEPQSGDPSN